MSFAPWESFEAQRAWKEDPEFRERIGRVRAHCEEFDRGRSSSAPRSCRRLEPADDRLGLVAREGAKGLGVLGAVALELQDDLGRGLVVRGLEDLDDVVAAERDVDADELAAGLGDRALAVLDALAPSGKSGNALRRPAHQRDVVRHVADDRRDWHPEGACPNNGYWDRPLRGQSLRIRAESREGLAPGGCLSQQRLLGQTPPGSVPP